MTSAFLPGPQFRRWYEWVRKKRRQVWIRHHLSGTLSSILAIVVLAREAADLIPRWRERWPAFLYHWRHYTWPTGTTPAQDWISQAGLNVQDMSVMILPLLFFSVFVVAIVTATLIAAIWDRSPSKLATSPQEVNFVYGMQSLLSELEFMRFAGKMSRVDAQKSFNDFVKVFLWSASKTLCAHVTTDAGLFMKRPGENILERTHTSDRAPFPLHFTLKIPSDGVPEEKCGPGGVCFHRGRLVYMPSVKKLKEAWVLQREKGIYDVDGMPLQDCWVKADKPHEENFSSILCAPVGLKQDGKTRYGVLEFATKAKDQFVDKDFMMAECFASVLSQAIAIAEANSEP